MSLCLSVLIFQCLCIIQQNVVFLQTEIFVVGYCRAKNTKNYLTNLKKIIIKVLYRPLIASTSPYLLNKLKITGGGEGVSFVFVRLLFQIRLCQVAFCTRQPHRFRTPQVIASKFFCKRGTLLLPCLLFNFSYFIIVQIFHIPVSI